ncbi:MAG: hypothetical protein RR253_03305 [Oscillospiraceae bacterium]
MSVWATRIKVLVISGVFASLANTISTMKSGNVVMPLEALPGIAMMIAMIIVGCLAQQLIEGVFKFHLPTIVYISMVSILASIPGFSPIAGYVIEQFNKIGLLPLCTPILAYAGISIGKDLDDFKKQGFAIICVSLLTFIGTFVGSAVVAQVVMTITHVI